MDSEPLDPFVEYTISFEVKIASGARKHGLSRRRIEQALAGQVVAETVLGGSTDPKSHAHAIQGASMTGRSRTRVRITGPEIDLDREVIIDSRGRRVDQSYVEDALAEVEEDLRRRAGRPSLTGTSEHSPHVTFRVTPEMKARAEKAAGEQGITVSALARLAFERYLSA